MFLKPEKLSACLSSPLISVLADHTFIAFLVIPGDISILSSETDFTLTQQPSL